MKESTLAICKDLTKRYPDLASLEKDIINAVQMMIDCYQRGGKLLVCGNGGSASDSLHIVGELMKAFARKRPLSKEKQEALRKSCPKHAEFFLNHLEEALPAISLVSESALHTAYMNDQAPELCFAQEVCGMGKKGDVLVAISTSGNSKNVLYASEVAKALGLHVISLTGRDGGKLKELCNINLIVQQRETYKIQERHLPLYHCLCLAVENEFFGG